MQNNEQQVLSDVDSEDEFANQLSHYNESSGWSDITDATTDTEEEEEKVAEQPLVRDMGIQVQQEEISCSICYEILDMTNCVVTTCGHYNCTTCFFRWIEINATCSQCRNPINSKTNLTDEQLHKETEEVYQVYANLLRDNNKLYKESNKLYRKLSKDEIRTGELMDRQIRLRKQLDETQGYNEGYLAGAYEYFHGHKRKFNSNNLILNKQNTSFMRGFQEGVDIEYRRLHRLHNQCNIKKKHNIKIKKRTTQSSLLNYGFNIEETNPFDKNFTIGLSDDDDDDDEVDHRFSRARRVEKRDIDIVMRQTGVSRREAVKALRENNNNLINAVLAALEI